MSVPADGPFLYAWDVAPSDTVDLRRDTRALYVGRKGDLSVTLSDGSTVVLMNVPAGTFLHLSVRRVNKTKTRAKHIVAFL